MCYRGSNYNGWQVQPNSSSIQESVQKCLSILLREEISVIGCGRTDTGVHARNFFAHFNTDSELLNDTEKLVYKINKFLPPDILIYSFHRMHDEAHSRFDAVSRTYKYYISERKEVFMADYCWQWKFNLDIELMNSAAKLLLNFVDFTSFSKLHTDVKTNICHISEANWNIENNMLVFTISADRFLRNMVRSIVGTLIDVGRKKITPDDFSQVIEKQDRTEAGMSAPAQGLFLENVIYPYEID